MLLVVEFPLREFHLAEHTEAPSLCGIEIPARRGRGKIGGWTKAWNYSYPYIPPVNEDVCFKCLIAYAAIEA